MSYENDYISVYDYNNENENENENDARYQSTGEINENIQYNEQLIKPSKKIKKNKFNYSIIFFLIALIILLYFLIKESCKKTSYYNPPMNIDRIMNSEPIFNLRK